MREDNKIMGSNDSHRENDSTIWIEASPSEMEKLLDRVERLKIRSGAKEQLLNGSVAVSASSSK
jgi:hypothetical protein